MPDLKNYEPSLTDDVTAGGKKAITLGAGSAPSLCFGSGVPTLSAAKGSLYLRTDGAANARTYVNTDGGTTWAAIPMGE